MINVYENKDEYRYGRVIARVKSNDRLDIWDGSNWQNGGAGLHKGITKLRKPIDPEKPYVIILRTQWQGCVSYGYTATAEEAVQEIVKADCGNDKWVWPELKEMINQLEDNEEEEEEE